MPTNDPAAQARAVARAAIMPYRRAAAISAAYAIPPDQQSERQRRIIEIIELARARRDGCAPWPPAHE